MYLIMTPPHLVERFYNEVWNRADEAVARAILHPNLSFTGSLGRSLTGIDEFISYLHSIHAALGNYTCDIVDLVTAETRAAAHMRFHGVHRGTFFGVPPTGRIIEWAGAAFFTIRQGQITELWVLGDVDAVKQQLGLGAASSFDC